MKPNLNIELNFETCSYIEIQEMNSKIFSLKVLHDHLDSYFDNHLNNDIDKLITDEINKIDSNNFEEEEIQIILQNYNTHSRILYDAKNTFSQYILVMTYSFFEKSLKEVLRLSKIISEKEIKECFKSDNLEKLLKKYFKIEYKEIVNNTGVSELKILNNDIKHSGKASEILAQINSKWICGNELPGDLMLDYERLKDKSFYFLQDLYIKINDKTKT